MSRDAAAALICKLGCRTELLQSSARAKVPTALREAQRQKPFDIPAQVHRNAIFVWKHGSAEVAFLPRHHKKLVDLFVGERTLRIPEFLLQFGLVPVVSLTR